MKQFAGAFLAKDKRKINVEDVCWSCTPACPNTGRATLSYQLKLERISDSDRVNRFTSLKWALWRPGIEFKEQKRRLEYTAAMDMYGHYRIHQLCQL
jgi:hypothetical protein